MIKNGTGRVPGLLAVLAMAPASTLAGFRTWVLEECPVAPGRRAASPAPRPVGPAVPASPISVGSPSDAASREAVTPARGAGGLSSRGNRRRGETKTSRFLALVVRQNGPLAAIPLGSVGRISAQVAPEVGLNTGAARAALRRAVLAAQDGGR